jgi:phage replication-related protein YjqB (UPF0714/DUF867 family)
MIFWVMVYVMLLLWVGRSRGDFYRSLKELRKKTQEGKDFKVNWINRGSLVTIASPHGGTIETGTSYLAKLIAGKNYNLYDFRGLRKDETRRELHITSSRFNDPPLLMLLSKSEICIAVHGRHSKKEDETVWLGGLNELLRRLTAKFLQEENIKYELYPKRLKGDSLKNFVNFPDQFGLQLELPYKLRTSQEVARAVRKAIRAYRRMN